MKTMTCDQVREVLAAEELKLTTAPDAKDACERHLAECARCRRAFVEGQELSELLESTLAVHKEGARERAARIAADLPAQRVGASYWRSRAFRLDAVAAVLLFGAGLFVGWWFLGGPSTASPAVVEKPSPLVAPVVPQVVGDRATTAHQLLPSNRVRTSGQRSFIILNEKRPDVILEVNHEAVLEDDVELPSPADAKKELPVK